MTKTDDGLFLLEVLVDKIVFGKSPCFSDKDFRTCVKIECLGVEPLEICDDEPGACFAKSGGPFVKTFNTGKSCLFSLKESDISRCMSSFPIKICVYKALPCGCLPTKIIIGEATIDMTKEFVEARNKFLDLPTSVSYQALKDSFRIIGPDGAESGEVVMYLRISCFGKLIITKFQGGAGPPTLGGSAGQSIVDRSCNPRKDYQSIDDPCACGGARGGDGGGAPGQPCGGGGAGVCPIAKDPYNSMPCVEGDDLCYCSGPKPDQKIPMACRNTDQYCLHVPKGVLPSLPYYQELTEQQKMEITMSDVNMKYITNHYNKPELDVQRLLKPTIFDNVSQYLDILRDIRSSLRYSYDGFHSSDILSVTSINTLLSKEIKFFRRSKSPTSMLPKLCSKMKDCKTRPLFIENETFGQKETTVFMTYLDDFRHRTSGTQATASINKCLQVGISHSADSYYASTCNTNYDTPSLYTMSTTTYQTNIKNIPNKMRYAEVYFWGSKKTNEGMGSSERKNCKGHCSKKNKEQSKANKSNSITAANVTQERNSSIGSQTKNVKETAASTCTGKAVSIKEDCCKPCPPSGVVKGDLTATISHIRIGPKEPCPVHGCSPCQGPKCVVASSAGEQVPVKVSTVTNPRRGVFELVIRRMTGAPLAKNELMLEWTPPPARPPCGSPCGAMPCSPPGPCRPPNCKMIVCRASPCKPKFCRKGCKRPCKPPPCRGPCKKCCSPSPCKPCPPPKCGGCGTGCCSQCQSSWPCRPLPPWRFRACPPFPCKSCKPCPPTPCRSCSSCKPSRPPRACPRGTLRSCPPPPCRPFPPPACRPCKTGPPPCCKPCPPLPCRSPCPSKCCKKPCSPLPCRSSPCISCCARRKRPRRSHTSPKIHSRRKHISPCCNRSKQCPIVRCRSLPGPCVICCSFPRCPPRKCCSFSRCNPC